MRQPIQIDGLGGAKFIEIRLENLSKFKNSSGSSQITKPASMLGLVKSNIKGLYLNLLKLKLHAYILFR